MGDKASYQYMMEPELEGRVSNVEMMWWWPMGPAGQIQKYLSFSKLYLCLSKTKSKAKGGFQ